MIYLNITNLYYEIYIYDSEIDAYHCIHETLYHIGTTSKNSTKEIKKWTKGKNDWRAWI